MRFTLLEEHMSFFSRHLVEAIFLLSSQTTTKTHRIYSKVEDKEWYFGYQWQLGY